MMLFRADGNLEIGTGHIMRCLAIADAFMTAGEESLFIISDNSMREIIEGRGHSAKVLGTDYKEIAESISKTVVIIKEYDSHTLIVDSYFVTREYLEGLKKYVQLIYIDDMSSFTYPVDILINYNIYADFYHYSKLYAEQNMPLPKMLLGTDYTPLRSIFTNLSDNAINKTVKNILISTGGTDPIHLAIDLIKALKKRKSENGINYHLLVGSMNLDKSEIEKLSESCANIILHHNVSDMKSLICSCDIAVSAAGSTLYEICACGVPLITYILADNQINGAKAFEEAGLALNCGDFRENENRAALLLCSISKLIDHYSLRIKMHNNMTKLVDGNGAKRIVDAVIADKQ